MVAIFTGLGTGFERGSGSVLGGMGLLGGAGMGRGGEQLYFNAANGNLLIGRQDEFLVGRGPDAAIGRTYNSLGDFSDENGDNWRQSTDRRVYGLTGIIGTAGSTVKRVSGDGSEILYTWDAAKSAYLATDGSGAHDKLTHASGIWTWTDGSSQVTEKYAAFGSLWRITEQADTDGNKLTFTYSADKLARITTADGSYLEYGWSGNNITQIVTFASGATPTLTRTRYAYDSLNRLEKVTVDLSPNDNSVADGKTYVTTYSYDGTSKRIKSIVQTDGSRVDIGYDASGRVSSIAQTVSAGVTRTVTIGYQAGFTTITDPAGQQVRLDYDPDGSLKKITSPPAQAGAVQQTVQFAYNASGDVVSMTDASGSVTSYSYDVWGNVLTATDPLGNVVTRTYGARNELLTETRTGASQDSAAASLTTRYVYDAENHLRYVISAEGRVTEYRYTQDGLLERTIEYPEHQFDVSAAPAPQPAPTTGNLYEASFETPDLGNSASSYIYRPTISGMTFTNGAGVAANGSAFAFAAAPSGDQVAFVQTGPTFGSSLSQTISGLAAGQTYTLKFFLAKRPSYAATPLTITIDGTSLGTFVASSDAFQAYTLSFTATASTATLTFAGSATPSDSATAIDSVSVLRPGTTVASLTFEAPEVGTSFLYNPSASYSGMSGIAGNSSAWGFAPAPEGDQVAFIQSASFGAGAISQVLSGLTAGQTYTLTFQLALRPNYGATPVNVTVGGTSLGTFTPASSTFSEYSVSFTASGGSATLSFAGVTTSSDRATAIDNVRLLLPAGGPPPAPWPTEGDLNSWRNAIADRSSTLVTVNTYDLRGNLASVTSYGAASAAGEPSTAEGFSRTLFGYSQAGQLITRNREGQRSETFIYDGLGRLAASTDLNGGTTTLFFDDTNSRTVVSFANGLTKTSTYNLAGELVTCLESHGPTAGSASYLYDQRGLLRVATDATGLKSYFAYDGVGRKIADVNHLGDLIEYRYDANNRLVATVRYANRLNSTQMATLANPLAAISMASIRPAASTSDLWTWQVYDKNGRLAQAIEGDGSVTAYEYDKSGRLVQTIAFAARLTTAQLDSFKATPPSAPVLPAANPAKDSVARNFYDKDGLLIGVLDGEGFFSRSHYDKAGRQVEQIAFLMPSQESLRAAGTFDQLVAAQGTSPAADRRMRYAYDGQGQLRYTIDGFDQVTELAYNSAGLVTATISYAGSIAATSDWTYDNIKALVASSGLSANAATRRSWAVYDDAGRLAYSVDAEGGVTGMSYDNMGQLVRTVQYAAVRSTASLPSKVEMDSWAGGQGANTANRTTRFYHNERGELRFTVDAEGFVSGSEYDSEGRVIRTTRWSNAVSVTDATTLANLVGASKGTASDTVMVYDSAGRLSDVFDAEGTRRHVDYNANGTVAFDIAAYGSTDETRTRFVYDNAGRVIEEYLAHGTLEQGLIRYAYDGLGNLTTITDPNGNLVTRAYDRLGRMVSETDGENATVAFQYNAFGEAVKVTDPRGNATYNYFDRLGRLTAVRDAEDFVTETAYNAFGEIASVTRRASRTTSAASVTVAPTVAASAQDATTRFYYDRLGRQTISRDAENYLSESAYNAFGDLTSVTRRANRTTSATNVTPAATASAQDATTRFYHDRLGRVTMVRDAEDFLTETAYNALGNVTRVIRRANRTTSPVTAIPSVTASAQDATTLFEYDRRGLLVKATDARGFSEQYVLDALGRRISVTDKLSGKTDYAYNRRGFVTAETRVVQAFRSLSDGTTQSTSITVRFEYDANGNRTKMIEAFGLAEQRTTSFIYDKANRLIETRGDAVQVLSQATHSNHTSVTPTSRIKYDGAGNVIETVDALGARTLFYYDKLNRTTRDVNASGLLTTYDYDALDNVTATRAYATAVALPATAGGSPPAVPAGDYREMVYSFDRLGRMLSSGVTGVRTGTWNGTSYTSAVGTIATAYAYDANNNVITATDANGGVLYTYYDRLGRSVAQVDQAGFLTSWTRDAEGNVLAERRAALAATGVGTAAPPSVAAHADDRITTFTYDKNGNRLTETRTGVVAFSVNASGVLAAAATASTISYAYNALGQVTRKTEATGEFIDYAYDTAGRLITEVRAGYADQAGITVRPTVDYFYNGLDLLARTRQGGQAPNAAIDRISTNSYGAGGRLSSTTDAAGAVHSYDYDAAGNLLREHYGRVKSDGSVVNEAILYTRDILGRKTSQAVAAWNGSAYVKGDVQSLRYNLFGEVDRRGLNVSSADLGQEQFDYDKAGRLWRTNSGDGVWRYFVLDGNGNQTLAIESEGTDLASKTIDEVLAIAGANPGSAYVDGINLSINVYDQRGMATMTRLPKRQLNVNATTTATTVDLIASRGFTAFGEVAWEKDAAGSQTNFTYNTMGRLIESRQPGVSITTESGAVQTVQPTEKFYYDVSGRLVGRDDANGNRTTRALLAGSGYGGTEEIMTAEFHADTGVLRSAYDVFGDLRRATDEMGRVTDMSYDRRGRLVQVARPSGLVESFAYDHLGQRLRHSNSLLGTGNVARTDYDLQGRVVSQVAFGGDTTTTSYAWDGTLATAGMQTFGGWVQTTTHLANGRTAIGKSDMFGRQVSETDLGGHVFTFSYDKAGRLSQRTGGDTIVYSFLNSGLVGTISSSGSATTQAVYGYDINGNKVSETFTRNGSVLQNSTASYDALGRITSWTESGNVTVPAASIQYKYDANGNVRRITASHSRIEASGVATAGQVQDLWYRYDSMNRVVISKGVLVNGQVTRDVDQGIAITYNRDGQRATSTRTIFDSILVSVPSEDGKGKTQYEHGYEAEVREEYAYNAGGNLESVRIARSTAQQTSSAGDVTVSPPPAVGSLRASYTHDAMGRLTRQIDWIGNGTDAAYDRSVSYNAKGQIQSEVVITKQSNLDLIHATTTNDFGTTGSGGTYALGAVVNAFTDTLKNGVSQGRTQLANGYEWWDGAKQKRTISTPPSGAASSAATDFFYNNWGQLTSASVNDGRPRTVTFTNDISGQAIRRSESDNNTATGDPNEVWYRFEGRQLGFTGNNGTLETHYLASIDNRRKPPGTGPFRFGGSSAYADFDQNYSAINSYGQGGAGGSHTVRSGDTLQSIAAGLWGDASLWYKLAEANGMGAATGLVEGQVLTIPSGVLRSQHNASTFKPFDPAEILGDLNPTTPLPQKLAAKNKCGVFGTVLLVAIAVAVSFLTYGALIGTVGAAASAGTGAAGSAAAAAVAGGTGLAGAFGAVGGAVAAGAIAGAAGALASQVVGVATGIQSKFDWKGVALSALGGAVGGALGGVGIFKASATGKFINLSKDIARAATTSAVTQGIGVATGLQGKFNWAGVAAAGVGAGVSGAVGRQLGFNGIDSKNNRLGHYGRMALTQSAGAIAGATTQSLVDGSDFGDNLVSGLAGLIGSTVGNAIKFGITIADKQKTPLRGGIAMQEYLLASNQDPIIVADSEIAGFKFPVCAPGANCPTIDRFHLQPEDSDYYKAYVAKRSQLIAALAASGVKEPRVEHDTVVKAMYADFYGYDDDRIVTNIGKTTPSTPSDIGDPPPPWKPLGSGSGSDTRPESSSNPFAGVGLGFLAGTQGLGKRAFTFLGEGDVHWLFRPNATLGPPNGLAWIMPPEGAALINDAASAYRYTGAAPSVTKAYINGQGIFGLDIPVDGIRTRLPTFADAGGHPHYTGNGSTGLALPGPNGQPGGFMFNPVPERVFTGGIDPVPGTVLFQVGPAGQHIPVRTWRPGTASALTFGRHAFRGIGAAGTAYDVYENGTRIYNAYEMDSLTGYYDNTTYQSVRAVQGMAGALAGGSAVATIGAEAGLLCGPKAWLCVPAFSIVGGGVGAYYGYRGMTAPVDWMHQQDVYRLQYDAPMPKFTPPPGRRITGSTGEM